jgi:DNA-binding CsgD family transcriptional regulator
LPGGGDSPLQAVPVLTRWGLSADADLIYRLLGGFGPRTAAQAGRDLGMPARRAAAALEELHSAGAVVHRPQPGPGPRRRALLWEAHPATAVVDRLRRRRLRIVDPAEQAVQHLRVVAGLALPELAAASTGQARRLIGVEQTRSRIAALAAAEQHEHLAMNPEQLFTADAKAAAAPIDRALLDRGVMFRTIARPPADGDRLNTADPELLRRGAQVREAQTIPLKLMVFDRKVALFPLDPQDLSRGAYEVAAQEVVDALVQVFLRHWAKGADPSAEGVSPTTLSPRERELVELLAQGHTDATAAAVLRLSPRSVAYALRGLMDRAGVENRFQLGLALGKARVAGVPARGGQAPAGGAAVG